MGDFRTARAGSVHCWLRRGLGSEPQASTPGLGKGCAGDSYKGGILAPALAPGMGCWCGCLTIPGVQGSQPRAVLVQFGRMEPI